MYSEIDTAIITFDIKAKPISKIGLTFISYEEE